MEFDIAYNLHALHVLNKSRKISGIFSPKASHRDKDQYQASIIFQIKSLLGFYSIPDANLIASVQDVNMISVHYKNLKYAKELLQLMSLKNIEALDFNDINNRYKVVQDIMISAIDAVPHLKRLYMNFLAPEHLKVIFNSITKQTITELDLSDSSVTANDIIDWREFLLSQPLKFLILQRNYINNKATEVFKELITTTKTLLVLDLSRNYINDNVASSILEAMQHNQCTVVISFKDSRYSLDYYKLLPKCKAAATKNNNFCILGIQDEEIVLDNYYRALSATKGFLKIDKKPLFMFSYEYIQNIKAYSHAINYLLYCLRQDFGFNISIQSLEDKLCKFLEASYDANIEYTKQIMELCNKYSIESLTYIIFSLRGQDNSMLKQQLQELHAHCLQYEKLESAWLVSFIDYAYQIIFNYKEQSFKDYIKSCFFSLFIDKEKGIEEVQKLISTIWEDIIFNGAQDAYNEMETYINHSRLSDEIKDLSGSLMEVLN